MRGLASVFQSQLDIEEFEEALFHSLDTEVWLELGSSFVAVKGVLHMENLLGVGCEGLVEMVGCIVMAGVMVGCIEVFDLPLKNSI